MVSTNMYRKINGNATAQLLRVNHVNLHRIEINSNNNEQVWLHLYNAATSGAVTVGTTVPDQSYNCPLSDNINYVIREIHYHESPAEFPLGLVWAVTKESDGGNTAPDNDCIINASYE